MRAQGDDDDDPKIERANAECPLHFNLAELRLKRGKIDWNTEDSGKLDEYNLDHVIHEVILNLVFFDFLFTDSSKLIQCVSPI